MKLYEFAAAPNPRRVRIFVAEKGMTLDTVQVNIRDGEQFSDDFRALNPYCTVPALVLDDGTCISESFAICRYLEALKPEPPLMGTDARDQGLVEMWHRRVEIHGLMAIADALRNTAERFQNHAVPSTKPYAQIPELAERGMSRIGDFFEMLDERLADSAHVAGEAYSIADILALVCVDFAAVVKMTPPDNLGALKAWHEKVSSRPSASA
ncbi:MAG: glutathione S-transferase [Proteobacteria bacterium]|nr:glutathione S-transferase [Pseudomonadota bacterium]